MKDSVMFLVIVFLAIVASGCAKQPSSDVRVVKRGSLECKVVKVYDPTSRSYVEEDACNTEYGLRGRVGMRAGYPVVLASPAEAALMTATHNPAAQRCQKFVVEMSDGTIREDEECVPADARVITAVPARPPVNLGTTSRR